MGNVNLEGSRVKPLGTLVKVHGTANLVRCDCLMDFGDLKYVSLLRVDKAKLFCIYIPSDLYIGKAYSEEGEDITGLLLYVRDSLSNARKTLMNLGDDDTW